MEDWIAAHQSANHSEIFLANVLFILLVHKRDWDTDTHASHIPLRFAVCNLYEGERLNSYPGGAIWDVNLNSGIKHKAFPLEFALLREKLAKLKLPEEADWIRLGRVHHQSTRPRGRNWHTTKEYLLRSNTPQHVDDRSQGILNEDRTST